MLLCICNMTKIPKDIPVYSIDTFISKTENAIHFQVEPFDIHRNFKVTYPHRHDDFYEILFITEGTGQHIIDFQSYDIKPFSLFFLSPGQVHELILSPDVKGYIFLFTSGFYHFNKTNTSKIFELPFFYNLDQKNPPLYLQNLQDKENLILMFKNAILETLSQKEDYEEVVRAILDLILIQCKRIYPKTSVIFQTPKGIILTKKFKQIIEQNYQNNWSIQQYAAQLHITANHLSEIVKLHTSRTPTDLVNDRMIIEIKRLLIHTNCSVSEIAYQLNFSDASYFSKYFKKQTQIAPLEFRKAHLK
ncbi:AraC family transcriptional regulator [Flavobacterium branchiophilum]